METKIIKIRQRVQICLLAVFTMILFSRIDVDAATPILVGGQDASAGIVSNAGVSGNKLTLVDATITGAQIEGIGKAGIYAAEDLEIVLKGNNTIIVPENSTGANYGIYVDGKVTISGGGSLTITTGTASGVNACIYTANSSSGDHKIDIQSGLISCNAGKSSVKETQEGQVEASYALCSRDGLVNVSGGNVTLSSNGQVFYGKMSSSGNYQGVSYGSSTQGYVLCNLNVKASTSSNGSNASTVAALRLTHRYAQITFHDLQHVPAKEANCLSVGNVEHWHCNGACGKNYKDSYGFETASYIIFNGSHSWYTHTKKSATCTEAGNDETWRECIYCGKIVDREYEELSSKPITSALGHSMKYMPEAEATCEKAGNIEYWSCSRCKKNFADEKGDVEITTPVNTDAIGHSYGEPVLTPATPSANGAYSNICSNCGDEQVSKVIAYPKTIILEKNSYTYNGKIQKPDVTVKDVEGNILDSSNYSVSYEKGRKNVGQYAVTVIFEGEYSGTVIKYFKILPEKTEIISFSKALRSFKATWKKPAMQISGYQIQYCTKKTFSNGVITQNITNSNTTSKIFTGLEANKSYYLRIRTYKTVMVNGTSTKIYSDWSTVKRM